MKRLILILFCVALLSPAVAMAGVSTFEGPIKRMKTSDLIPHYHKHKSNNWYYENFYFKARIKGGMEIGLHLKFSNIGLSSGKAVVITELKRRGAKNIWLKKRYSKSEWSYAKDKFSVKIGSNTMSGKPGLIKVTFKNDTMAGWVEFKNVLRPWVPGTGRVKVGSKAYHYVVMAPRAKVTGEVTLLKEENKKIVISKGVGMASRSYMTGAPHQIFKRWIRLERMGGQVVMLSTFQVPDKHGKKWASMLYIAKGRKVLVQRFDVKVKPQKFKTDNKHVNRYKVPIDLLLTAGSGDTLVRGQIKATRLIKRSDQLKDLNRFERFIVSKFAKPVYYRFRAKYKFIVKVGGVDKEITGSGVFVYQQLTK